MGSKTFQRQADANACKSQLEAGLDRSRALGLGLPVLTESLADVVRWYEKPGVAFSAEEPDRAGDQGPTAVLGRTPSPPAIQWWRRVAQRQPRPVQRSNR